MQYVELKAKLQENQVELFLIEESEANIVMGDITIDPDKDKLRVLRDEETLAQLYTPNVTNCGHLVNSKCSLQKPFNKYYVKNVSK